MSFGLFLTIGNYMYKKKKHILAGQTDSLDEAKTTPSFQKTKRTTLKTKSDLRCSW